MSTIPDRRPLAHLSIPGTHNTMALYESEQFRCQSMPLEAQLEAGIRALDISLSHVHNKPMIRVRDSKRRTFGTGNAANPTITFGMVLRICARFLSSNPSEVILMRIKREKKGWLSDTRDNTRPFARSFSKYVNHKYKNFIWRLNPSMDIEHTLASITLGQVRGKVVILQDFGIDVNRHNGSASMHRHSYAEPLYGPRWIDAVIQNNQTLMTIWSLYFKWNQIKSHLYATNASLPTGIYLRNHTTTTVASPRFHINFLSGSGGLMPYFVASGYAGSGIDQRAMVFGIANADQYKDFPRSQCSPDGGQCLVNFEGTNMLTYQRLVTERFRFVGIIYADFPGSGLIGAVINVNKNY